MRQETVNIYKFREVDQGEHLYGDEYTETLKAFTAKLDLFDIVDYQYGGYNGADGAEIEWYNTDLSDLSGARLWKYLQKHYADIVAKGLEYSLTGFCADYDILKPLTDFMTRPDSTITFDDLIQKCLDAWVTAAVNDLEYGR